MTIKCECGMNVEKAWMITGKHQKSRPHHARMETVPYQQMASLDRVVNRARSNLT